MAPMFEEAAAALEPPSLLAARVAQLGTTSRDTPGKRSRSPSAAPIQWIMATTPLAAAATRSAPSDALILARCLLQRERWCHRAVERVEFLEGQMVRRELSLHLFNTGLLPAWDGDHILVPVTSTAKIPSPLRDLRVLDPCGDPMPIVGTRESEVRLAQALVALVERALPPRTLTPALRDRIRQIVEPGQPAGPATKPGDVLSQLSPLAEDEAAFQTALAFASFVAKYQVTMAVVRKDRLPGAGVVRYSYCADLKPHARFGQKLRDAPSRRHVLPRSADSARPGHRRTCHPGLSHRR